MYLCCDLGASSADWAVFNPETNEFVLRNEMNLDNYDDFYEMLDHFLSRVSQLSANMQITSSTIGVAGRLDGESATLTNVEGWDIRAGTVRGILTDHGHSEKLNIINDFEALSLGTSALMRDMGDKTQVLEIYGRYKMSPPRVGEHRRNRSLVCGPGTGLGIACLIENAGPNDTPIVVSSEGGHISMAPESIEQNRFVSSFNKSSNKTSYEDALSKQGLRNIYNFYRKEDYKSELNFSISANDIISLSKSGNDQASTDALSLFCEILANFCGNMALTFNIDRAIFLWGGALLNMPSDLLKSRFKQHYADRCMHSDKIQSVPVILLRNADIPLRGCALKCSYENSIQQL